MGNTHIHPCKYTKYTVYLTLKQIHKIHKGGVFSPPAFKYTKYTVYFGSEANTLNTYFPSMLSTLLAPPGSNHIIKGVSTLVYE